MTTNEQKAAEHKAVTDAIDALLRAAVDGELLTCESMTDLADKIKRADYWRHVRDLAEAVKDDVRERVKGGDDIDEAVSESLHEHADSSAWVIYTRQNFDVLRYSENEDAAVDEFGAEGIASRDGINWALLAFCALQADVREQLGDVEQELADEAETAAEAKETEA